MINQSVTAALVKQLGASAEQGYMERAVLESWARRTGLPADKISPSCDKAMNPKPSYLTGADIFYHHEGDSAAGVYTPSGAIFYTCSTEDHDKARELIQAILEDGGMVLLARQEDLACEEVVTFLHEGDELTVYRKKR